MDAGLRYLFLMLKILGNNKASFVVCFNFYRGCQNSNEEMPVERDVITFLNKCLERSCSEVKK